MNECSVHLSNGDGQIEGWHRGPSLRGHASEARGLPGRPRWLGWSTGGRGRKPGWITPWSGSRRRNLRFVFPERPLKDPEKAACGPRNVLITLEDEQMDSPTLKMFFSYSRTESSRRIAAGRAHRLFPSSLPTSP